jgi:hypothetical protein
LPTHSQPFLCLFIESLVLSLALCPTSFLQCRFSVPPHPLHCLCLITVHCLFFSFVGGISLLSGCAGLCSQGWIRESHVVWCSPVISVNQCTGKFGASSGEKLCQLFLVQCGIGMLSTG